MKVSEATLTYLHENHAWNWAWPGVNGMANAWPGAGGKRKGPKQRYHGPSKKTLQKRDARRARRKAR